MTVEEMYQREIKLLTEQLYNAYSRIKTLNEQIADQKNKNGKD